MKVTVTATDSFVIGNKVYHAGDDVEVSIYDARLLAKSGLTSEPEEAQQEERAKMEGAPENKMADAPANKSRTKKAE